MKDHTDLLNLIAEKIDAKTYLEIGIYNSDHNFNKVNVPLKVGVDPDPAANANFICGSDEYFQLLKATGGKFSLVFIDGLHHADQVRKDIQNAWDSLAPGGVIVLHDCNPPTKDTTCVPRGNQRQWCGDVYRVVSAIASEKFTVDFDYGCTVLRKFDKTLNISNEDFTWEQFSNNRESLLNLISTTEAIKKISEWRTKE